MRIQFKKQLAGSYGAVDPGDERNVPKSTAKELIALGYAVEIDGEDDTEENVEQEAAGDTPVIAGSELPAAETGAGDDASPQARRAARRRQTD